MMAADLRLANTQEPDAAASSSGNGGNGHGGLINHRLKELERRVTRLENDISEIKTLCTEIKTGMSPLASKTYVLWVSVSMISLAFLTLFGHAVIRWLTIPSA